jgi:hypothetical protein
MKAGSYIGYTSLKHSVQYSKAWFSEPFSYCDRPVPVILY